MDSLPALTSSPPAGSETSRGGTGSRPGTPQTRAATAAVQAGARDKGIKRVGRKWPAGPLNKWSFRVLSQLSHHFPAAIRRVGEIVNDPDHTDNFLACKFVIENLIRDGQKVRGPVDGTGLRIVIETAAGREDRADQATVITGESEVIT